MHHWKHVLNTFVKGLSHSIPPYNQTPKNAIKPKPLFRSLPSPLISHSHSHSTSYLQTFQLHSANVHTTSAQSQSPPPHNTEMELTSTLWSLIPSLNSFPATPPCGCSWLPSLLACPGVWLFPAPARDQAASMFLTAGVFPLRREPRKESACWSGWEDVMFVIWCVDSVGLIYS